MEIDEVAVRFLVDRMGYTEAAAQWLLIQNRELNQLFGEETARARKKAEIKVNDDGKINGYQISMGRLPSQRFKVGDLVRVDRPGHAYDGCTGRLDVVNGGVGQFVTSRGGRAYVFEEDLRHYEGIAPAEPTPLPRSVCAPSSPPPVEPETSEESEEAPRSASVPQPLVRAAEKLGRVLQALQERDELQRSSSRELLLIGAQCEVLELANELVEFAAEFETYDLESLDELEENAEADEEDL